MGNIRNHSGFQTCVNDRSVALSPAHQKQGPFPPPTLLGLHGYMTLSDFRAGHHPIDDVGRGDLHHTRISRNYPDHLSGMLRSVPRRIEQVPLSISSLSVLPSPVNRRVGIHDFTFEACSSFTRVTACRIACPPKSGLLSRGFGLVSCPTKPLSSFHAYRQLHGWIPPPQVRNGVDHLWRSEDYRRDTHSDSTHGGRES